MKMKKILVYFTTVIVSLANFAVAQEKKSHGSGSTSIVPQPGVRVSETPSMLWPFYVRLKFNPQVILPGPLKMTILFSTILGCNNATLRITEIGKLEFSGQTEWNITATAKDTLSFTINVNIPDNDTTGFRAGWWPTIHGWLVAHHSWWVPVC